MKKTITWITYIVIVVMFALTLRFILQTGVIPIAFVVVEGKSMLPTLWTGDIVVAIRVPPEEIRVGDVIVFRALADNHLVIHRVIEVNVVGSNYYYVTKGDNNIIPDNFVPSIEGALGIPYERVEGVVVGIRVAGKLYPLKIPLLGFIGIAFSGLSQVLGNLANP